mgnify:CR=1 FL=1
MNEQVDAPIINVRGNLVGLGPLRREYIPLYQRWMNDFETTRFLDYQPRPMTLEQETTWYEQAATKSDEITFTIYELSTGRPIGRRATNHGVISCPIAFATVRLAAGCSCRPAPAATPSTSLPAARAGLACRPRRFWLATSPAQRRR